MIPQEHVERLPLYLAAANVLWHGAAFVVLNQLVFTYPQYYFWIVIVSPPLVTLQLGILILLLDFQALRVLIGVSMLSFVLSFAHFVALVFTVVRP